METPLQCSSAAVRRLLLKRTLLYSAPDGNASGPTEDDVLAVLGQLECVQLDPVAAVERNQHLTLGARMKGYRPPLLNSLLESGKVFEYVANAACVLPMEDYPAVQAIRRRYEAGLQNEIDKYSDVVRVVLRRLEEEGPLPASAFESEHKVHGYWDNQAPKTKATSHVLNLLNDTGRIRVVKRQGNTRYFHLSEYLIPPGIWETAQNLSTGDAQRLMLEKYMRAYRVFDLGDSRFGWAHWKIADRRTYLEPYIARGEVIPLAVEGCRTQYFILAQDAEALHAIEDECNRQSDGNEKRRAITVPGRDIRLLPPLDNLLWRRTRLVDFFNFEYKWEIYTPAVKRTFGYYTMPILAGDALIGRVDPLLKRDEGTLVIKGLWLEPTVRNTKSLQRALEVALNRFARFHGANQVAFELD